MSPIAAPSHTSQVTWPEHRPRRLVDTLFTTRCAGCDRVGSVLCTTCRFVLLDAYRDGRRTGVAGPHGLIAAVALTGGARRVVHSLKYRNRRAVVDHLAGLLVTRIDDLGLRPGIDLDVVTWAPTHTDRRRQRGYDQAELLARATARRLGLPVRRLLSRVDDAGPQTGRTRRERRVAPAFAGRRVRYRAVLLIDDVVTTGSTLAAASGALRTAGAEQVVCAALAATPLRVAHPPAAVVSTAA